MKKLLIVLLVTTVFVCTIVGCEQKDENELEDGMHDTFQKTTDFSETPFENVQEGGLPLSRDELNALVASVPSNQYISYPHAFLQPISAMLYLGGESTSIDVNDPRLIQLINLYNHSVHHRQYSYLQGLLDQESLEQEVLQEEIRLELTFESTWASNHASGDFPAFPGDTLIITNKWFVVINHSRSGYEGFEDEYPYYATAHFPLHHDYPWLDLFGF